MRDPASLEQFLDWPSLPVGDQAGRIVYATKCKRVVYCTLVIHPQQHSPTFAHRTLAISTESRHRRSRSVDNNSERELEHTMSPTRSPSSRRGSFLTVCRRLILLKRHRRARFSASEEI